MFFFTRYKNAPLATVVSFISGLFLLLALYLSVGYFLGWEGVNEKMSLGSSLAGAVVCAGIWFGLRKLAENMAARKQQKLAEKAKPAAASTDPVREERKPAAPAAPAALLCPNCGVKIGPDDRFCVNCGTKLKAAAPAAPPVKKEPERVPEKPAVSPESSRASAAKAVAPSGTAARESTTAPAPARETPPKKKSGAWLYALLGLLVVGLAVMMMNGQIGTGGDNGLSPGRGWKKADKAPEITNLAWNSQEQTVEITFRKNGLKGTFHCFFHFGRTTDEKQISYGDEVEVSADDVVTVSAKNGTFVPGEWQTFYIRLNNEAEKTYAYSTPMEIQIPINRTGDQRAVLNYSVQPISFSSLKSFLEDANAAYEKSYDEYKSYVEAHVDQVIRADVELSNEWLRIVTVSPSGVADVAYLYGRGFSEVIAGAFRKGVPLEKGKYSVRFYDWDHLCLADPDTFVFTVE